MVLGCLCSFGFLGGKCFASGELFKGAHENFDDSEVKISTNSNGETCTKIPKVRTAIKAPTHSTRAKGYHSLANSNSTQSFTTIAILHLVFRR